MPATKAYDAATAHIRAAVTDALYAPLPRIYAIAAARMMLRATCCLMLLPRAARYAAMLMPLIDVMMLIIGAQRYATLIITLIFHGSCHGFTPRI